MKTITILTTLAFLTGCAVYTQTNFSEWRGGGAYVGQGGAVKTKDGIEIWTHGAPDKPFEVIGLIEQNHYDNNSVMSTVAGMNLEGEIVAKVKESGGDGIAYITRDTQITGYTTTGQAYGSGTGSYNYGSYSGSAAVWSMAQSNANTRTNVVVIVFKYLPAENVEQ